MTDASSGSPSPKGPERRRVDRGRGRAQEVGRNVLTGLNTLWKQAFPALEELEPAAATERSSPPPDEPVERRDVVGPIVLPAQGYVFGFTVRASLTWSCKGVGPDVLHWYAHHFRPDVIQRVKRIAAGQARRLPPHRAGELETALQRALTEEDPPPWTYQRGDLVFECLPEMSVRLEDRVRQVLQPHWERLIELELQNELYTRRARYAERLNRRWVAMMNEFVGHPTAGEAAETFKEELDRARQHMMAEQEAAAQWSRDLLRDRQRHEGIFEPFTSIEVIQRRPQGQAHETSRPSGETTSTAEAPPDSS
ncbi:hypothetical protein [Micromonospora sp. CPCC 205556]|uniref:hypothetical protein n=1 Tax=Micromonospora sp. CPCC 205556 TaxID=3122398 RepID=UPI002FEFD699